MNEEKSVPETTPTPQQPSSWKAFAKEIIIFILIAVCIVLPFRILVAEPYIVSGASMDPTFTTGNYLIVDKLSYNFTEPKRNSVVVFKFPTETSRNLIKRIIGLPGDTVSVDGTTVTITNAENPKGFVLNESYLVYNQPNKFSETLGADEYFVMGDNRPASFDSRAWGKLPRKDILGKPLIRLYPFSKIGILPGDATAKVQK